VGMTWESTTDHVNVEVYADGHLEYFHEDLTTGALWSDDDVHQPSAPLQLLDRLNRMV